MPLLTTSVPNLVQGVSQQPDNLRHPGQAESQTNALSSVVDGLTKRPNTDHVKVLSSGINNNAKVHVFNRDSANKHLFIFANNSGAVSLIAKNTTNGDNVPVTISSDAQAYLNYHPITGGVVPEYHLSTLSVADYTFVANNQKTVEEDSATSTALANEAIVFVKQGNDTATYNVTVNGVKSTYAVPGSGYTPAHSSEEIASALATDIAALTGVSSATANGSAIKVVLSSALSVTVSDSISNTALGLVYKEVNYITDLPAKCFNGHRVKVRGDIELSQDDYYVKFVTKDSAAFGEGAWEEDIGYGVKTSLNKTTMPIVIVPTIPSTTVTAYTVECVGETGASSGNPWANRLCGDDTTNEKPSFVGQQVNDMFFYKNRLGILTDTSVVFSEADKYFNFYRTTVLSLLDSAPIDVGIAHTKITTLRHAIAFQEKLVLFSDHSQFVLRGNELLTPKTVNISPVTEYELKAFGIPLAMSNFIYFPYPKSSYTGVYEYYVDNDNDTYDAVDLTAQVPAYVPSDVYQLIGSPSENVLIGIPTSSTELYVYKYFWQGKDKIQSSWSKFTFANTIRGLAMVDSILYLIIWDGTNLCMETLDFSTGQVDSGKTYKILLDRRVAHSSLTRSYSASSKLTTVSTMPYDPANAVIYTLEGARHVITRTSASAFTVNGDFSSAAFFVGREYDMEYEFSTQTLKQPTERGGRATSNFTNQILRNGAVDYSDTGHFTVEVTPQYRDSYSYAFNPSILGADSTVGSLVLDDGSFRFPIHCKHDDATIKIKSSSALPMKVLSAEFENFIHARSRRYS